VTHTLYAIIRYYYIHVCDLGVRLCAFCDSAPICYRAVKEIRCRVTWSVEQVYRARKLCNVCYYYLPDP